MCRAKQDKELCATRSSGAIHQITLRMNSQQAAAAQQSQVERQGMFRADEEEEKLENIKTNVRWLTHFHKFEMFSDS